MPVAIQTPVEKWTGAVREVTLGATAAEGGTRTSTVVLGGQSTLPFLHFEGAMPHKPAVAVEILDVVPADWSPVLREVWGDVMGDAVAWARKAVEVGAELLVIKLRGAHPDGQNRSAEDVAETVQKVLGAIGVPLIVYGPDHVEKDNEVLVKVAEAAAGERLALGNCESDKYRTIVAAALAHKHVVIGKTPIEINMAKQLNILMTDMGQDPARIIIDPTTGALGYGLEYSYSIIERIRLSALQGDGMMQMPIICTVGEEAWRAKESKADQGVPAAWGPIGERALTWEILTASSLLLAGADCVVLRHPVAVQRIKASINKWMQGSKAQ